MGFAGIAPAFSITSDELMKETKAQANYVPHAKKNHCSDCTHFRGGTCTEVQGAINPDGSSDHFTPKAKAGAKKR